MAHKHLLVQSAAREKVPHGAAASADAVWIDNQPNRAARHVSGSHAPTDELRQSNQVCAILVSRIWPAAQSRPQRYGKPRAKQQEEDECDVHEETDPSLRPFDEAESG